jgi:hypothetical protein
MLVPEQVDKIVFDSGVVSINGDVLAPCEGDNAFVVEREYREIPYNGSPGKTKGLKRVLRENVTLTVHPKGLTQAILLQALPGATLDGTAIEGGGKFVIPDEAYNATVTLVGYTKDGMAKKLTVYNALADNGLTFTAGEDSEVIVELAFAGHYNMGDLTEPIYKIEDIAVTGTSTVTFTVATSGTGDEDLATVKFAGRTKNPTDGTAVFAGVAYGSNRPYEVHLDGHESAYGSLTVDSSTEAVSVTLTEL